MIFEEEEQPFGIPMGSPGGSLAISVPLVMPFAADRKWANERVVALKGEEIWCQLFSEPSTGSDLAMRIAGGADEMLLNTIAERILGLPQDHRPDKGVAFKDISA